MPPDALDFLVRARAVCKREGWTHALWSENDLATLPGYMDHRHHCQTNADRADLGRYCILWHKGGLYIDMDIELFRLPRNLTGAWICPGSNFAMAAPAGHPYLDRLLIACANAESWVRRPGKVSMAQVNLCMAMLAGDVRQWGRGDWEARAMLHAPGYGQHHMLNQRWGSQVIGR